MLERRDGLDKKYNQLPDGSEMHTEDWVGEA